MKLPFCSPECRDRQGLIEDPETGLPVGRCACRTSATDAAQAANSVLASVAAAHPKSMDAAVKVIRDVALSLAYLSGNDCRELMLHAQISGAVVGAAFRRAESLGYIAATDRMVQSTDPDTRHRITIWQSLICKAVAS